MKRRIASLWFENLSIERITRARAIEAPFALTLHQKNADRLYALNTAAQESGLGLGLGLSDARALCATLQTQPADLDAEANFLNALARFSQRFCPWVGLDGADALALDITGSTHLWQDEAGFIKKAVTDFARLGLSVKIGIADTRGAAWALSHFAPDDSQRISQNTRQDLRHLPIAALRIKAEHEVLARRLGLHIIGDLYDKPRAQLARRFGTDLILLLDQALGDQFETISPIGEPRIFAARISFPEPIGRLDDVMAGLERLLKSTEKKLTLHGQAIQKLNIQMRRVDGSWATQIVRFARPMRRACEISPLLEAKLKDVDSGFGFDLLRIVGEELSDWSVSTIGALDTARGYHDLLSKIGNRIGFDNIQKLVPRDRHWSEKSFEYLRFDQAQSNPIPSDKGKIDQVKIDRAQYEPMAHLSLRPLTMFAPEYIAIQTPNPPERFSWRRMKFHLAKAIGPERIAPEWWCDGDDWRLGVRDYWRVATYEGRRLWMFYTPQNAGWYVQGEFA